MCLSEQQWWEEGSAGLMGSNSALAFPEKLRVLCTRTPLINHYGRNRAGMLVYDNYLDNFSDSGSRCVVSANKTPNCSLLNKRRVVSITWCSSSSVSAICKFAISVIVIQNSHKTTHLRQALKSVKHEDTRSGTLWRGPDLLRIVSLSILALSI